MKDIITIVIFISISSFLFGQDIKMEDYVYDEDVASVQILVNEEITPVPIIRLNTTDVLKLQFDDLGDHEDNEYFYRIVLCDKEWRITNLDPTEYIDGFHEERLRDWQNALGTFVPYTHYWMSIPNRDTRPKSSGNYILYIYNRYDDEVPVLTRRFIVSETIGRVINEWSRPSMTEMIRSGQQLNLDVDVKNFKMPNPQRDLTLTVIRNGDWHDAKHGIKSRSYFNGLFSFDKFGITSFKGLNEYRSFDTRSLRGKSQGIIKMIKGPKMMEATLRPDLTRDGSIYLFNFDFNGNYYVDNRDDFNRILFENSINGADKNQLNEFRNIFKGITEEGKTGNFSYFDNKPSEWNVKDKDVRSDYVKIKFSYKTLPKDEKIYLYGAFTDFKLRPEYEMIYNETDEIYEKEIILKQGYYNYMFATGDKKLNPNFEDTESSWQDTENEYKVIVYYKEHGSRIDRVLCTNSFNSSLFRN